MKFASFETVLVLVSLTMLTLVVVWGAKIIAS